MRDFFELFIHELRDTYAAELLIEKTLPEMARLAYEQKLKDAFRHHHQETINQILRIEEIAAEFDIDLRNVESEAMRGIIREGRRALQDRYPREVNDALLISAAQRVEHYEIASYGTLRAFAKHLKLDLAEDLLNDTLKEEGKADKLLTEIAEGSLFRTGVNEKALRRSIA